MPASSEETRRLLVEAATHEFAEHGVRGASLLEISRRAGQRNRASVHYHFGSRTGMLVAVLTQHHEVLRDRNAAYLAQTRGTPDDDITAATRALLLPAVEIGETGPLGRGYLQVLAELSAEGVAGQDQTVVEAMTTSGGYENWLLLGERLALVRPDLSAELRDLRRELATGLMMRAVADRGRARERGTSGVGVTVEDFTADLLAVTVAMLTAPPVAEPVAEPVAGIARPGADRHRS